MDTAENTAPALPERLSTDAAVDALLGTPSEPQEPETGQSEGDEVTEPAEAENTETVEATDQAEEPEQQEPEQDDADHFDTEADAEMEAEQSEETAEEPQQAQLTADTVIFHDREGNPVTAEEAHKGYLRQADYTKKTQEIAEQRKHVAELFQQRQHEREVLAENINLALNVVEPQLAELQATDWDNLAKTDPYEYAQKRAMFEQASIRYNELQQAGQQTLQQAEQERQQQFQAHLRKQMHIAQQLIPELADPQRAPTVRAQFKQYLTKAAGYSPEEASSVTDARMLNLIHKAMKYDLMQASQRSVKDKKVNKAPRKGMKPGTPKTAAQRQEAQRAKVEAKFKQTGKLDDAVDLLLMGKQ